MPAVPIQRLADWVRCRLEGVHPRLVGGGAEGGAEDGMAALELTPDDLSGNPYWRGIGAAGDPDGFGLELQQRPTGRLVFAAYDNGEETCQNLSPFPNAAHAWLGFQPIIKGFPYRTNPAGAPFGGARPGVPAVIDLPVGKSGYRGGDRILYRCLEINGLLAPPDEGVHFSMPQGYGFEIPAERQSVLGRGVRVAYFLTEEGDTAGGKPPDISTAREQRVAPGGRRKLRFTGPYRRGRKLPTRNETKVEPPQRARRTRDYRFVSKNGGDVRAGRVIRVIRTYATLRKRGQTGQSDPSDRFDLPGEPGPGRERDFSVGGDPREFRLQNHGFSRGDEVRFRGPNLPRPIRSGENYFVRGPSADAFGVSASRDGERISLDSDGSGSVVPIVDTHRNKGTALEVDAPPRRRGCDGWYCYLMVDNQPFMAFRPGNPERASGFIPFGEKVRVHIDAQTLAGNVARRGGNPDRNNLPEWSLVSQAPPGGGPGSDEELLVGLEPFEGALEAPRTFRVSESSFEAGEKGRWCNIRVADCFEDASGRLHQGLPSRRVRHFVPANHAPMVVFHDPINDLSNAEGRESGADGKPLGWEYAESNGSPGFSSAGGVHEIRTAGPGASSSSFWQRRDQDQTREEVFAGLLEAAMHQGAAEVAVEEYGVPASDVRLAALGQSNPTAPLRTTVLASGAAVRTVYERVFGPVGSPNPGGTPDSGVTAWHQDTVSWRFVCRMTGATRNGRASVTDPLAGPDGVAPRKTEKGGPHEPASFDADGFPEAAHVRGPLAALGPAPATGAEVPLDPPFVDLTFGSGEPTAAQGWTKETQGATAAPASALDGTPVIATVDPTQNRQASARYRRDVPEWTSGSGGLAVEEDLVSITHQQTGFAERGRISDAGGNPMIACEYVAATGEMRLRIWDRRGNERAQETGQRVRDGEKKVSWEIVPTGGGTEEGRAVLLVGRNGADRRPAAVLGGIDWSNRRPGRAFFGLVRESNPQIRSNFNVRRVRLSERGAPIGEAQPSTNPPPEDRPTVRDAAGNPVPVSADPDGEKILQWALWVPPGLPAFDTPVFWRMAALPGETYSLGLERRDARYADGMGEAEPWFVEVLAEDGRVLPVGSLHGAAASGRRSGWGDRRFEGDLAVRVPADFGAAVITARHKNLLPGFYLWQRFAPSLGPSVVRGFGRQTVGEFAGLLDPATPNGEIHGVPLLDGWIGPRVAADVPGTPGCSVEPFYNSADEISPGGFPVLPSPDVPDPASVRERAFARLGAVLTGDGRDGPEILPGGAALLVRPFESALLRRDGTQLDAGTVIYDLEEPSHSPLYETTLWDNRPQHDPVSSPVAWLAPFKIQVFSAAARSELEGTPARPGGWLGREWLIEASDHDACYRVVAGGPLSWQRKGGVEVGPDGRRYGLWEAQAPGAMVVESWTLGNPVTLPSGVPAGA